VQLVGDARDRLVDRVRNVPRETADKVQDVAERVMEDAESAAHKSQTANFGR
jgi:hypothetical protein